MAAEEGKPHVSEKVKAFWRTKLASHEELLQVLKPIGNEELKKQYLEKACSYSIAFRPSVMVRTTRGSTLATSENVLAPHRSHSRTQLAWARVQPNVSIALCLEKLQIAMCTCILVSRNLRMANMYLYYLVL